MAIVALNKVTLYGSSSQKSHVLDGLQNLGCMHLVDVASENSLSPIADADSVPGDVKDRHPTLPLSPEAHEAIKYLRACPIRRRTVKHEAGFDFDAIVQQALHIQRQQQTLKAERDELKQAVKLMAPWGDFQLPATDELGDMRFWFYVIPHYRLTALHETQLTWQVVARDHRFDYVVVISPTEPSGMPVARVHLDDRSLSELQRRLEEVETELEDFHWQRVALTQWCQLLSHRLVEADDRAARQQANEKTLNDPNVFAVQGWVPRRDMERINAFAAEHNLALSTSEPTHDDTPPTLLDNPGLIAGGEQAVTFYMTPAYRAWDPSAIVFVSFSVFFAMIMADAGYALVLGAMLLLFWRKLGRSSTGSRVRMLAAAILLTSVGYGALVGSYFGLNPQAGSVLERLHLIDAADTGLMMRISIGIGVIHLALAHLVSAWQRRYSLVALSSLGWVAILLGGLALGFGKTSNPPSDELAQFGTQALLGGLIAVLLFSSERQLMRFTLSNQLGRLLDGLKSLAGVSRAFGDVLSYLRLFALGLASAQLAATFNQLTYSASCCVGVGSLLAVIVVVFGHGLNLALAVMSGVVHGLRLNCIEFFGWGLPEEGYPFRPLCRRAT